MKTPSKSAPCDSLILPNGISKVLLGHHTSNRVLTKIRKHLVPLQVHLSRGEAYVSEAQFCILHGPGLVKTVGKHSPVISPAHLLTVCVCGILGKVLVASHRATFTKHLRSPASLQHAL